MVRSAMYPRNLFVRSAYWHTWSRVLRYMQRDNDGQIEVNLTTPNVHVASEWERNSKIWIRRHVTSRDPKDLYVADLPNEAVELMKMYLDKTTIHRLLHEDLLPQLNMSIYNSVSNGGAPMQSILKS